jgi:hypothetical protein
VAHKHTSFRPQLESLDGRIVPSQFGNPTSATVGTGAQDVAVGDFNGDGKLDVVTANQGTYNATTRTFSGASVSVLLGDGRGGFGTARNYAVSSAPSRVVVGDFNGDGKLDVAAGGGRRGAWDLPGTPAGMSVLLGKGDGTFKAAKTSSFGMGMYATAADVNGDGKLDLVTTLSGVLLGNGDGTFRAPPVPGSGKGAAAVGDLNGDGKLDVVAFTPSSVALLAGNGDGTFGTAQAIYSPASGLYVAAVAVGDFSADGNPDVAVGLGATNSAGSGLGVVVLTGDGAGAFSTALGIGTPFAGFDPRYSVELVAADVNGDGTADLIGLNSFQGTVHSAGVSLGRVGGGFSGPVQSIATFVAAPTALAVGDINRDGYLDVVMAGDLTTGAGRVGEYLWIP